MKRLMNISAALLLAVVMIVGVMGLLPEGAAAIGEPPAGTTASIQNYTLVPSTVITEDGTTYSDAQQFLFWNAVDLFVTADLTTSTEITITAQVSADGTNFADATYTYAAETLAETTSVVTSTDGLTASSTVSSSSTPTEQTYQIVLRADGTDYIRLPMAGQYLRVSIEASGDVTPTVIATMRNN
jgi:hypothetical protein